MSDDIEEIGGALFRKGQLIRDAWWSSWLAGVEQIMAQLRAGERFAGDFAHLLPEPPPSNVAPVYRDPPPMPSNAAPDNRDAQLRVWQETFGRMPGEGQ